MQLTVVPRGQLLYCMEVEGGVYGEERTVLVEDIGVRSYVHMCYRWCWEGLGGAHRCTCWSTKSPG